MNFRLDPPTRAALDATAERLGLSRSAVIRVLVLNAAGQLAQLPGPVVVKLEPFGSIASAQQAPA